MSTSHDWTAVDVPFESTLHDVTVFKRLFKKRVYAVGTGGALLERVDGTWSTILDGGPTGNSKTQYTVEATDFGKHVWFAGASGTLAYLDTESGAVTDYSQPKGQSGQWTDLLPTGRGGNEVVRAVDSNGQLVTLRFSNGNLESTSLTTPHSSGTSIGGLSAGDGERLHAVNANGKLFSSSGELHWAVTDLADTDLVDVTVDGVVHVITAGGAGYAYDPADGTVRPFQTGLSTSHAIAAGGATVIGGADGALAELVDGSWQRIETSASSDLHGVAVGPSDFAVGSNGTILERER